MDDLIDTLIRDSGCVNVPLDWKRDNILERIFFLTLHVCHYFTCIIYSPFTRGEERNRSGSFFAPQSIFLNLAATLAELMQRDASSGLRLRRHSVTVVTT